jgi:hypothetical protein
MYHIFYMKCTVLLVFSCVFIAETWTFKTFDMYTKIHMYHIFYMKCTVLLVFLCVFTVFLLQKHVFLVHFTCIPKYTFAIYSTWNAQVCLYFNVFSMCFHCRNMYLWYISHVYQNTHVLYILHEMHSFFIVYMCFHCRNMYFWYISHVYQNTHVPYTLHEMHSFASVFMCFHCV